MTGVLYTNNSDNNVVNKSLTKLSEFEFVLKDATSVMNPTLILRSEMSLLSGCNYVHIPELSRYYHVNDIVSTRSGVFEVSCSVDVLMSFKDSIRQLPAILERQEKTWNLLLDDGSFTVYSNPLITHKRFERGLTDDCLVLLVGGGAKYE